MYVAKLNQDISTVKPSHSGFLRIRPPLHWRGVWLLPRIVVSVGLSPFWTEAWLESMLLLVLALRPLVLVVSWQQQAVSHWTFHPNVHEHSGCSDLGCLSYPFPTTIVEGFFFSDYSGCYVFPNGPWAQQVSEGRCIFKKFVYLQWCLLYFIRRLRFDMV